MIKNKVFYVGPDQHLIPEKVREIAYNPSIQVALSPSAKRQVKQARDVVEDIVKAKKRVYGVTTGFGSLKDVAISEGDVNELQKNLIRSHAAGVGPELSEPFVRAALLVRIQSLSQGHSGVRLELLERACDFLNKNIIPVVPSQGSVGSSGDLAPLSHMGLLFFGEGEAWYKGKRMKGKDALKKAGLAPLYFTAKEGLAWNNGTSVMTGIAALTIASAQELMSVAEISCALTVEALCGMLDAFREEVHTVRPHPGQQISAKTIRSLISGSHLVGSVPERLQDAYSLRCASQVHGAIRDAFSYVYGVVDRELSSVTDNPLIFTNPGRVYSGGNFHGEPIALAMDFLGIALAELADIAERRIAKLVDRGTSEGLPPFLIAHKQAGLHSGFMIPQYTAAALVSENKVLAHPASVDSIPTSANQEDHVSMGTIAARKAWNIFENVTNVIAIELITAAQAVDFRGAEKLGRGTKRAHTIIRNHVSHLEKDRELATDINIARSLIISGKFKDVL